MSKIVCDVCGTSYPETATQCPICGCVRPVDTVTVDTENNHDEKPAASTYTYVKGGRFSKANVKKRNSRNYQEKSADAEETAEQKDEVKVSKGLTALVCVLLLAIIAVVIYIVLSIFAPTMGTTGSGVNITANTTAATTETTEATEATVPCEDVLLSNTEITLEKIDAAFLLNVSLSPTDSTDEITFASADESVATVDENGKVVAIAPGTTVITVTCGEATAECRVQCDFEVIPEDTTAPETEPVYSTSDFKLNREDFTMTKKGETWLLYKGEIPAKQIVWTSDNEKVVTIQDGVVTAVGTGNTEVHGEYNGVKVSCVVRCHSSVGKYVEPAETTDTNTIAAYTITPTDVTLNLNSDNSFELKLLDADRNAVEVIWTVADPSVCSVSGNTVTGLKAGTTTVSVTYEGEAYSCIVRVK